MMQVPHKQKINGVDVDRLATTIDSIKANPMLADFKFRAHNRWIDGGYNQSTIKNFYGAGEEDTTRTVSYVLDADEPPVLLGEDKGANPVEHLLHALASCVTTSIVYHAASKGIEINEFESQLEGDIDLNGFLGLDPSAPKGYKNIRIKCKIKADAPEETLIDIIDEGKTYSPVFNTLSRGVPINVELSN